MISVRELWLPPSRRATHTHTRLFMYIVPRARIRAVFHVCPEMTVVAYICEVTRGMRSASGENREKFRTKESREEKKLYVQLPIPPTRGKVGFLWPARPPFSPLSGSRVLYVERTNLFPWAEKKLVRRYAPCLGVRSVE